MFYQIAHQTCILIFVPERLLSTRSDGADHDSDVANASGVSRLDESPGTLIVFMLFWLKVLVESFYL